MAPSLVISDMARGNPEECEASGRAKGEGEEQGVCVDESRRGKRRVKRCEGSDWRDQAVW